MTAQIPDSFLLHGKNYSVAGVNGTGLFNPPDYDMQPLPRITSCWRGYVCTYAARDNKLLLATLQVNLGQEGPRLNHIRPEFSPKDMFDNTYRDFNLPMDFTGGILVAEGFIGELYVHMGYHPAWKYETVFELSISQGTVLETRDISQQMAELRTKMIHQPLQPGTDASNLDLQKWIASTFKRNYRF